ncbi:MAG: hypothetical protein H7Y13_05600 [Sphingobacteriaceae bacterium]|nr:hypothetical protein [Sphingobacteriaceae bacterium]
MKKIYVLLIIASAVIFQYCATTQKASNKSVAVPKVTYVADVQPLLVNNCSPCHFPPKGNKEPLDTYLTAKNEIDETIERIKRNPGEKGFMPAKHPKLSDSTINVFVRWKADGLLEK